MLHSGIGDTGCAMCLMSLIAALERAGGGERILLASYGNGCDVVDPEDHGADSFS